MRFRHAFFTFLTAVLVILVSCVKNAGPNQDMLKTREIREALALSRQFADSNAFRSAQYAEVAIRNAYKLHDTILLCEGFYRLAFANIQQNKLDEGNKNLSAVFGIIKKNNQPELLFKAYYLFGLAEFKRKSFDQSLLFYDSALVMIPRLHWGGENDEQLIRTAVSVMSGVGLASAKTGLVHDAIKMMFSCNAFTAPVKLKMYAKGFLAEMYRAIGSYDTAILYTDTAITLASQHYDDSFLIKQWGLRANVYYQLGKYDSCIVYNKRAEVLAIRMKQKRLLPPIYNNLASVYQKISNLPLAVVYFSKSLKIKEEYRDSNGIAVTLSNLGIIYENWGDQHKAQEYFSRALKINQKLNNQAGISVNYLNFGELYFILGQFESAVDYFNRALEIKKEQKDVYGCIIALDGLGRSYRDQPGKSQMALTYFTEGKRLAENINAKYWIASLIDDEVLDFFQEHHIGPLISFDGPKEIQDLQRPYRNGRGSFDSTAVKIRKLLDRIPGTSCRATWLPGNDPEIVIRGLRECGFARIMLLPATIPSIRDRNGSRLTLVQDYTPLIRQAEKETVRLKKAIRERDAEGVRFIAMASILLTIVRMLLHQHSGEKFCGAGSTLVGVSSTGELYPCHRFFGNHSFRLGNIFNRDFDHWFNPWRNVDDLPACNACEARYTCLGGCYHDNYNGTGDYTIPLPESCRRRKAITALAESVVHDLDEDDKKFLYHENLIQHKQCMLDFG